MRIASDFSNIESDFHGDILSKMLGVAANYLADWAATGPLVQRYNCPVSFIEATKEGKPALWSADTDLNNIQASEFGDSPLAAIVAAIVSHEMEVRNGELLPPIDLRCEWFVDKDDIFNAIIKNSDIHNVNEFPTDQIYSWRVTPKNLSTKCLEAFKPIPRLLHQLDGRYTQWGTFNEGRDSNQQMQDAVLHILSVAMEEIGDREYASSVVFQFKPLTCAG